MPKTPKLPVGDKKGKPRPKYYSDCIKCLSNRSVLLVIEKKDVEHEMGKKELRITAQGRCKECGHQTFISVMDEETFKTIRPSLLDEIVPSLSEEEERKFQEEVAKNTLTQEDVEAIIKEME